MINLNELIYNSGDSTIEGYSYSAGILTLDLNAAEFENKIRVKIHTDMLSFNGYYLNNKIDLYKICRIEIQPLTMVLNTENGIYIPAKTFEAIMKETRLHYNLAYGKKASEFKYLFSLTGYDRIVNCLLSDLSSITIIEIF
ncbi:hypothetical protein [Mucilaginibacter psychrotolerans]|uniref:Uncharacterized protein n=1 Tax=Mucilaginibacter psychrotolerans TaxID=1524096 RepID=A0A4Y8SKB4_9SPHI|nr:hypothetical protein [Mucilaginibacter psychrotolerans]TFF39121.1 hypothetical protein E2R66_05710 [Mucilaginibacter psychrotolerans]